MIDAYPNFDLTDYFIENEIQWKNNVSDDHIEYSINCPMCPYRGEPTPDVHKKLWINSTTGTYFCYRCNWAGSLVRLIQGLGRMSIESAVKVLKGKPLDPLERLNLKLVFEHYEPDEKEQSLLRDIELPYSYTPLDEQHPYLKKRGVPFKVVSRNDWGICSAGFCKDRIIVPFYMKGMIVFWQARATWDEPDNKDFKKVLNPKGVSAKPILYNYDTAGHYEEVILVEGFMDAVKVGSDAMATNGKRLHINQVELLKETNCKKVILAWDADAWTDERRRKDGKLIKPCSMQVATDLLRSFGIHVRCAKFPPKRDPGSFPYRSDDLLNIIDSAKEPSF